MITYGLARAIFHSVPILTVHISHTQTILLDIGAHKVATSINDSILKCQNKKIEVL